MTPPTEQSPILFLPQMPRLGSIIVELLEQHLSQWNPRLFPQLERQKWVHLPRYEIPQVSVLSRKKQEVVDRANSEIRVLESQIAEARHRNQDWYTLLRGTGDDLVTAVIRSLQIVGFERVVDMDAELKAKGQNTGLKEDIQVRDRKPILIIDVKGVNGHPDDDEARQAQKHAIMRINEWRDPDVQPLTIVNHQRHLPPHERDDQPFRKEIVQVAEQTGLGLMTTWDLFRILRNLELLHWPKSAVQAIFYRTGRVEAIPGHYRRIGTVEKLWTDAIGVVPAEIIRIGDRLAIEANDTFTEFEVASLQVDRTARESANAGEGAGVGFRGASEVFREKTPVFKIDAQTQPLPPQRLTATAPKTRPKSP